MEYIVMDGGSTDETAAVVKEYADRLKFISERDRGQSHAINKGFALGRGEVLAWINSDDLLLEGAVSAAVEALDQDRRAAAIYGEGLRINEQGDSLGRFQFTEPFNLWKLVNLSDYVLQQSLFMRRDALEEVGPLNEDLHYTMDWDLLIRIGKRFPLRHVPRQMGAIREYPTAKSFRGGRARVKEVARLLRRHTGARYPPGLLLHALENRPGPLPLRVLTGRWVERLRTSSQGLFRDGWATKTLRYMLPPGDGAVTIRGYAPIPQTLRVRLNERDTGQYEAGPGPFAFELEEPGLVNLEIHASNSFQPASCEGITRRLSWLVRAIERRVT
jgi:hypothetical protein